MNSLFLSRAKSASSLTDHGSCNCGRLWSEDDVDDDSDHVDDNVDDNYDVDDGDDDVDDGDSDDVDDDNVDDVDDDDSDDVDDDVDVDDLQAYVFKSLNFSLGAMAAYRTTSSGV